MFYNIAKVLFWLFFHVTNIIRVRGGENVPKTGNFILCPSHGSNWDPLLLGVFFPRRCWYMAKEELFHFKPLAAVVRGLGGFPIKRGKGDFGAVMHSIKVLNEGKPVAIFPEGKRNLHSIGAAKHGAVMIAIKAEKPIVPVAICGKYGFWRRLTIRIGEPLELSEYYGRKLSPAELQEITDHVLMKKIKELKAMGV